MKTQKIQFDALVRIAATAIAAVLLLVHTGCNPGTGDNSNPPVQFDAGGEHEDAGEEPPDASLIPDAGGPAPENTALPSLSGITCEGQTLTASTGTWSNAPSSFGSGTGPSMNATSVSRTSRSPLTAT